MSRGVQPLSEGLRVGVGVEPVTLPESSPLRVLSMSSRGVIQPLSERLRIGVQLGVQLVPVPLPVPETNTFAAPVVALVPPRRQSLLKIHLPKLGMDQNGNITIA